MISSKRVAEAVKTFVSFKSLVAEVVKTFDSLQLAPTFATSRSNEEAVRSAHILLRRVRPVFAHALLISFAFQALPYTSIDAADRTRCFLPIAANDPPPETVPADTAILKSGLLPTEALGIDVSSTAGDADWWRYLQVWSGHHDEPATESIRRWLALPLDREFQSTARRGRVSPKFLPWRAGSFAVVQTPHFEILSRVNEEPSNLIARDLERCYWVWTQMYFPLWSGRDQSAVGLADWNPQDTSISNYLTANATSRLSSGRRHRVVLLPDQRTFELTISNPQIAAGRPSTVAASTGFYSNSLSTSFFFPQSDRSSIAHEICHQLFEEATDRKRSGTSKRSLTETTNEFWLVEGIAGHFESLQFGDRTASVGGWDSNRLQYARYQSLIARAAIPSIEQLRGNLRVVQQRADLPAWYSTAIVQTHFALDSQFDADTKPTRRTKLLTMLADLYDIDITDFACLRVAVDSSLTGDERMDDFLMLDDSELISHPITGGATSICVAGCEITDTGWTSLPPLPRVTWFDASRTPITDSSVQRLVSNSERLEQLSLEATKITPAIGSLIGNALNLREIDLSWTAIDDSVIDSLAKCQSLETIWLTGTPISDQSVAKLISLPKLMTIDVQRTQITEAGLQRLRTAKPELELNPLKF